MATTYLQTLRGFSRDVRLYLINEALSGFCFFGIYSVLFNLYLLRLGYGPEYIGLVNGVGALGFALSCLPAGVLGTRWSSRRMIITGVSLLAVGYGLTPLAEFVPTGWRPACPFATNALTMIGLALTIVNGPPFLMSATGAGERNHAFSVQSAVGLLAGFGGSLVAGLLPGLLATSLRVSLEDAAPYRYPLLLAALLLIAALLALLATQEVRVERPPEHVGGDAGPVPVGPITLMTLVTALRFAGRGAVFTFSNLYMDAGLHVSTSLIGSLSAAALLLSVPAALATPLLVARWRNERVIFLGSMGFALSMLPLAMIAHWGAAGIGLVGAQATFWMTTAPIRIYSQQLVPPRWRGTMSGAIMMGGGLSASAMSLGGGYVIATLGYRTLFSIGSVLSAVGALLFWGCFRVERGELARVSTDP